MNKMRPETPLVQWNHHNTIELQKGALQISWILYQSLNVQGAIRSTSIGSEKTLKVTRNTSADIVADSSRCAIMARHRARTTRAALFAARQLFFTMTSSTTQTSAAVTNAATMLSSFPNSLKSSIRPPTRSQAKPISSVCAIPCISC